MPWTGRMQVTRLNDRQVRAIEYTRWADARRRFKNGKDRKTVDAYKEKIQAGKRIEPIHLGISARYPDDVYVRDGHHRAVAYMELGVRDFPFVWSWIQNSGGTRSLNEPFPHKL